LNGGRELVLHPTSRTHEAGFHLVVLGRVPFDLTVVGGEGHAAAEMSMRRRVLPPASEAAVVAEPLAHPPPPPGRRRLLFHHRTD
jgi:hypothetical protein